MVKQAALLMLMQLRLAAFDIDVVVAAAVGHALSSSNASVGDTQQGGSGGSDVQLRQTAERPYVGP